MVEFDTLEAVNIEFVITAQTLIDTNGTENSPTIKIIINEEDIFIPDIIVGSLPSPYEMAPNSVGIYQFDDPFTTNSQDHIITNHELTSTSETLELEYDLATGKFSISIDTTSERTIYFTLSGEI